MRNHGVLVVGATVPWVVVAAATLERAARIQAIAGTMGGALVPMSAEDAGRLAPEKYRDGFVQEYWEAWLRRVGAMSAGPRRDRRQRHARDARGRRRASSCSTSSATSSGSRAPSARCDVQVCGTCTVLHRRAAGQRLHHAASTRPAGGRC